jgi:hypothetical protein
MNERSFFILPPFLFPCQDFTHDIFALASTMVDQVILPPAVTAQPGEASPDEVKRNGSALLSLANRLSPPDPLFLITQSPDSLLPYPLLPSPLHLR